MASCEQQHNECASDREASIFPAQLSGHAESVNCKIRRAVDLSRDVSVAQMDRQDMQLLNKMLHERPHLLSTSTRFHYIRFAELFDVPRVEVRSIDSAEGVLDYLTATREVELTVADLLVKLWECQKCFDVVRQLADQIVKRGQNNVIHR